MFTALKMKIMWYIKGVKNFCIIQCIITLTLICHYSTIILSSCQFYYSQNYAGIVDLLLSHLHTVCNIKFMFLMMTSCTSNHYHNEIISWYHERNIIISAICIKIFMRTDAYKYSFFPHTDSLWNKLPGTFKEICH